MRTVDSCGSCNLPQTCGGADEPNVCGNGTVIDNESRGTATNQLNFSGSGWTHENYVGYGSFYNSTRSFSSTTNDAVSVAFKGTQIKLYGIKGPAHGKGAVKIDGGAETTIDFFNASLIGDQLLWTSPLLSYGTHTLSMRVTGSKNSGSTGYAVMLDRVGVMDTWMDQDIGNVGASGSVTEVSGGLSVAGSGGDVYGSADEFHFVYQNITGDATVTARVASLTNPNAWTKALVMMRDGSAAGAANVAALLSPTSTNSYRMQYRASAGSSTTSVGGAASAIPAFLRVTRAGDTFTASYSTDGATFTPIGSPQTINMADTIMVGIGVTSHADGQLATGVFDNIAITTGASSGSGSGSGSSSCGFTVNKNAYDGPNAWGTVTFTNNGPASASNYVVEFDVPSGQHCTNDAVPSGATLSPLSGSGTSAYTSSNHCVFTWTNTSPLAAGSSKTVNYSTTGSATFDAKASTVVSDLVCNP
jgi:hypothetical protein